ncbi:DUF7695 domain-containing protein [Bifidobacterium pullorum]|uniref:DUF7695 domain-containing protein n=1 Tax=Bifidobacterium pullorum TaxID=78448 RepID=UPI003AF002FE
MILRNSGRCRLCGRVLVSRFRHEMDGCACGAAVDGGLDYQRLIGPVERAPWSPSRSRTPTRSSAPRRSSEASPPPTGGENRRRTRRCAPRSRTSTAPATGAQP